MALHVGFTVAQGDGVQDTNQFWDFGRPGLRQTYHTIWASKDQIFRAMSKEREDTHHWSAPGSQSLLLQKKVMKAHSTYYKVRAREFRIKLSEYRPELSLCGCMLRPYHLYRFGTSSTDFMVQAHISNKWARRMIKRQNDFDWKNPTSFEWVIWRRLCFWLLVWLFNKNRAESSQQAHGLPVCASRARSKVWLFIWTCC